MAISRSLEMSTQPGGQGPRPRAFSGAARYLQAGASLGFAAMRSPTVSYWRVSFGA